MVKQKNKFQVWIRLTKIKLNQWNQRENETNSKKLFIFYIF